MSPEVPSLSAEALSSPVFEGAEQPRVTWQEMQTRLREFYAASEEAVRAYQALIASDTPDAPRFAYARWKLHHYAGKRLRFLEEVVYPAMIDRGDQEVTVCVTDLRRSRYSGVMSSYEHIERWPLDRVMADWDRFRHEATGRLAVVRDRLALEVRVLYPILRRFAAADEA